MRDLYFPHNFIPMYMLLRTHFHNCFLAGTACSPARRTFFRLQRVQHRRGALCSMCQWGRFTQ